MLICPQCEFENPDQNKFCQSCGTSLTHKTCDQCGTEVLWQDTNCSNCGAITTPIWWGIIYRPQMSYEQGLACENFTWGTEENTELEDTLTLPSNQNLFEGEEINSLQQRPITRLFCPPHEENSDSNLPLGENLDNHEVDIQPIPRELESEKFCLDCQKRYWLTGEENLRLQQWLRQTEQRNCIKVKVADSSPLQPTLLKQLLDNENVTLNGEKSPPSDHSELDKLTIPSIAHCYRALHKFAPTAIPKLHDAWQEEDQAVILLEDRSQWQLLTNVWDDQYTTLEQKLHWLDEMVQLWGFLSQLGCSQSLLEASNLRLDEDETLSVQQLYADREEQINTLKDLGSLWRSLFERSQQTILGSLNQLLDELHREKITTVEELSLKLRAIRQNQIQSPSTSSLHPTMGNSSVVDSEFLPVPNINYQPLMPPLTATQESESLEDEEIDDDDLDISEMQTVVLPMRLCNLEYVARTDRGRQRQYNEDYFGIETQIKRYEDNLEQSVQAQGLFIVCDGMGGHAGGEDASLRAVLALQEYFRNSWQNGLPDGETIRAGVFAANQAIYQINQSRASSGSQRMGTTLVMGFIHNTKVVLAHVGDSRVYSYTRKQGLELLTVDHEVGRREMQNGASEEIAYARPDAYQLTQALGPRSNDFIDPDLNYAEIKEDTLLILCSDGLSDHELLEKHADTYIAPLLSSRANLEQGMDNLIKFTNQYNGHDNITVVIIRMRVRPKQEQ